MTVHSSSQVELLRDPDQLQQQKDPMTKGNREGIRRSGHGRPLKDLEARSRGQGDKRNESSEIVDKAEGCDSVTQLKRDASDLLFEGRSLRAP